MSGSRYPAVPPDDLTPDQKVFHDEMAARIQAGWGHGRFTLVGKQGEQLGPLSIMTHTPDYSIHTMDLNREVLKLPGLEKYLAEIAIFVVQGYYTRSFGGFLIYAHARNCVAEKLLTVEQMEKITCLENPGNLGDKGSVVFDLAVRLLQGGKPLEDDLWNKANAVLGKQQTLNIIQIVAYYSIHGITLNAGVIGTPAGETTFPAVSS